MTKDTYRSQFRLPWPLYEQLKAASEESGRSLNAELVARLQESFDEPQEGGVVLDKETEDRLLARLLARIAERRILEDQGEDER